MQHASRTHDKLAPDAQGSLCPACDSSVLRVSGSVLVDFEVRMSGAEPDVLVVGDTISSDGWDLTDDVHCPRCGWRGAVADVEPLTTR